MIVFCAAHIQEQRAGLCAQDEIGKLSKTDSGEKDIELDKKLRNLYDFVRTPTFCRVGPIAQAWKFGREGKPNSVDTLIPFTYFIVKIFSSILYMIVPTVIISIALCESMILKELWPLLKLSLVLIYTVTLLAFLLAFYVHIRTAALTMGNISKT